MAPLIGADAKGLPDAERLYSQLAAFLLDLRWLWPSVASEFVDWMSRQFDTEGAFGGDPWAPLSPGYLAWKTTHFPGKGILSATGALRKAATSPKRTAEPQRLTLTIEPYQRRDGEKERTLEPSWFQDGTGRMPARPLIFETLPTEAAAGLEDVVDRAVVDLLNRLGRRT